jgi:hypothetical protein
LHQRYRTHSANLLDIAIINWKNLAAFDDPNDIGLWCGRLACRTPALLICMPAPLLLLLPAVYPKE